MLWPENFDIAICGAGMSGLVAAISAAHAGKKVLLLEKAPAVGGSMALSGGFIWTFADMAAVQVCLPDGNPATQSIVVERLAADLDWLASLGVRLGTPTQYSEHGLGRQSDPAQMLETLSEILTSDPAITLLTDSPLQRLLLEGGRVKGIEYWHENALRCARASHTIIATGGFQGNPDLLQRYGIHNAPWITLRANPWSTGDGLCAALAVGAATAGNMGSFYGHALLAPPARFDSSHFLDVSQKYGPHGIAVNLRGQRFADESLGTGEEYLNRCVADQPMATAFYVTDAQVAAIGTEIEPSANVATARARSRGGAILEADSIDALARKLAAHDVPPALFVETMARYNDMILRPGESTCWPPRRFNRRNISEPPFRAVQVRAGITFTGGGVAVDQDLGVINRNRSCSTLPDVRLDADTLAVHRIPGLYAVGADVGGVSGTGYMGGLATALTTARQCLATLFS